MSIEEEEDASLKELVTKTLHGSGVLGKIQAQLRASVFLALEEEFRDKNLPLVNPATRQLLATPEGSAAAALVYDFLHTLGLDFSLAVFAPESGHPSTWPLPPTDSLASHLRLNPDRKGSGTPLLVELVRERQGGIAEVRYLMENGDLASLHSHKSNSSKEDHSASFNINSAGIISNPPEVPNSHSNPSSQPSSHDESQSSQSSQEDISTQQGRRDLASLSDKQKTGESKMGLHRIELQRIPDLTVDEAKQAAESSLNGDDKHYEDDFSSMSERGGKEEEDDEDEVTEDIDEDISLDDLINSSASAASDQTKDQPLSQASNPPDYQEDL